MNALRLPAALESIPAMRALVRDAVRQIAPDADTGMLEMALEELLVNVASYAYPESPGEMEVACSAQGDGLTVVLSDQGAPYDPRNAPEPDLEAGIEDRAIGGLGVFFAKKVFSSMDYKREAESNVLTLTYAIPT
ncbi:ATP-binding protein [Desulfocurvus sp. DL9XJH121]